MSKFSCAQIYKADGVFSFSKTQDFFLVFVVWIPNKAEIPANNKNIFFSKLVKLRILKHEMSPCVSPVMYIITFSKNEK